MTGLTLKPAALQKEEEARGSGVRMGFNYLVPNDLSLSNMGCGPSFPPYPAEILWSGTASSPVQTLSTTPLPLSSSTPVPKKLRVNRGEKPAQ